MRLACFQQHLTFNHRCKDKVLPAYLAVRPLVPTAPIERIARKYGFRSLSAQIKNCHNWIKLRTTSLQPSLSLPLTPDDLARVTDFSEVDAKREVSRCKLCQQKKLQSLLEKKRHIADLARMRNPFYPPTELRWTAGITERHEFAPAPNAVEKALKTAQLKTVSILSRLPPSNLLRAERHAIASLRKNKDQQFSWIIWIIPRRWTLFWVTVPLISVSPRTTPRLEWRMNSILLGLKKKRLLDGKLISDLLLVWNHESMVYQKSINWMFH